MKSTSNYPPGMPLTTFVELSPIWSGESPVIPFGDLTREARAALTQPK